MNLGSQSCRCSFVLDTSRLGGAIHAALALDDGADGAQREVGLVDDGAQRLPGLAQLEHGGDLCVAGGERTADVL